MERGNAANYQNKSLDEINIDVNEEINLEDEDDEVGMLKLKEKECVCV